MPARKNAVKEKLARYIAHAEQLKAKGQPGGASRAPQPPQPPAARAGPHPPSPPPHAAPARLQPAPDVGVLSPLITTHFASPLVPQAVTRASYALQEDGRAQHKLALDHYTEALAMLMQALPGARVMPLLAPTP